MHGLRLTMKHVTNMIKINVNNKSLVVKHPKSSPTVSQGLCMVSDKVQ